MRKPLEGGQIGSSSVVLGIDSRDWTGRLTKERHPDEPLLW